MTAYRQTLKHGDTLAVDVAPDPIVEPPPVEPPPSGNLISARTNAEILALLTRKDLGALPIIVVPKGTVLAPFQFKPTHGGPSNDNRTTVRAEVTGEVFLDCKGGRYGLEYKGGRYFDIEGLAARNGDFTQNAIVTFGDGTLPPATKGVAIRRMSHDATCRGPARAKTGTAAATAHFVYLSGAKAGETHHDILVEDLTGHADDVGLAAMLHLYSGATVATGFVARRCTGYGYTQAVMGYAPNAKDVLIEDFVGIDCYTVLRLPSGTGRVVNAKSSHPGSAPHANPLYAKGSGWTVDSVAGLS